MSLSASLLSPCLVESSMTTFVQELLVFGMFILSFLLWPHISPRRFLRATKSHPREGNRSSSPSSRKGVARGPESVNLDGIGACSEKTKGRRQSQPSSKAAVVASQPHARAAEQQMLLLLEQREFTRALNIFRALERDGRDRGFSEELFSAFIQSAIRVDKADVVECMLNAMKQNRVQTSLQFWQAVLKMLSSRKHFNTCLSVYALFEKELPEDRTVFSCLINAALEVGASKQAAAMLGHYGKATLDAKDHVLFFRVYVALNNVEAAEAMYKKLGDQVSTLMLNLVLLTCVNAKQPEKAFNILLEAHDLESSLPEKLVDLVSYKTVLKGFAQARMLRHCFDALHEMLKHGLEPDEIMLATLLDNCIKGNNMEAANEVINLLMRSNRPVDTLMCTLFIKGLVRANCLPKALQLYEEMKCSESARPDIVTYSLLIKALVEQHDVQQALHLVEDMTQVGHMPDDIILTHLLEGCRYVGNHALGKKLFQDMLAAGLQPSEFTLMSMLKLHGRCGAHRDAHALVASWERQHGAKPKIIHYTCLMSGCLRGKNYKQAWSAYELMCENHVPIDKTAMSTLLPGLVTGRQWDHVVTLVRHAVKATPPIAIPAEMLNNALGQMLEAPAERHADQLRVIMQQARIRISGQNTKSLQ